MLWTILAATLLLQEPASITRQIFQLQGEVGRVDRAGRTVTITSAGVISQPIYAGPNIPIFDQLSIGDHVVIKFYDSYIVEVTPGERMGPPQNATANDLNALGTAEASVTQQTKLVVTVDAVDAATATVTYHGFDNRRVFRVVQDRKLLDGLKVGDVVTITYTRATAAEITKQ
jgi:Cu/Ag efflux protein CusF